MKCSDTLLEGLKHEEMEGMLIPIVNIDEFEPKSGTVEEIIVVGFYTKDEMSAEDLSDFIERSHVNILDAEASPNPEEHGFYMVFAEIERDKFFIKRLSELLNDVERVAGDVKWKVKPYLADRIMKLTPENLEEFVITDKDKYMTKDEFMKLRARKEEVSEFLRDSVLEDIDMDVFNSNIRFNRSNDLTFDVVDFGNYNDVFGRHGIQESALDLNYGTRALSAMRNNLGPGWSVLPLSEYLVVSNEDTDDILLLTRPKNV